MLFRRILFFDLFSDIFHHFRGVLTTENVFASVGERDEEAVGRFTIVGDVEYGSQNPFSDMKNVECVGFHKDVKPFVKDAHAIVLPSYHEGMANVLLEGASMGRPILASNIPGCQETFDEGITGFGFDAKNVESLYCAIGKFIALPYEQKVAMGKAGRRKIEDEFNRQIVVNKYLQQINSL